jgi:hypothetical protein
MIQWNSCVPMCPGPSEEMSPCYLSDRLNEVRTQSVAGRNKSEYYLSDRLSEAHSLQLA